MILGNKIRCSLFFAAIFLFPLPIVLAEDVVIGGNWGGINNRENTTNSSVLSIPDNDAVFAQNVDVLDDRSAIRMRSKYYTFNGNIGVSTWGARGGTVFKTSSAVETYIFSNDQKLYKSTNLTSWTAFVTTDTAGSYYDFAEFNGSVWRANSNRDEILKYDGATVTYYPLAPKGDQIEFLPDRAVISGTQSDPNTINFSAAADFTDYATGINEESAFTETVGVSGDAVKSIKRACGGLLIFSEKAINIWTGTNQFDGNIENITGRLGTKYPNTVIEKDGIIYFMGNDDQFYSYDCNTITILSKKIDVNSLSVSPAQGRPFACSDSRSRIWISNPSDQSYVYNIDHKEWLYHTFSAQACFESSTQYLMFGGPSTGAVFGIPVLAQSTSGGLDGANFVGGAGGTAFTAYWQTKPFTSGNPFQEDNYLNYSFLSREPSFTFGYDVTYAASFTDTSISGSGFYVINNGRFPAGLFGRDISFKFSASSATGSMVIYAFKYEFSPRPWRVLP